jgi:hypothetical protein
MSNAGQQQNLVDIQVITTSGNFPATGFQHFNVREKLSTVLHQAATHLKLVNTDGWVARIGERELNPEQTIGENGITGSATIRWAPKERGGGC